MGRMKTIYNTEDEIYNNEALRCAILHAYNLGQSGAKYKIDTIVDTWKEEYLKNTTKQLTLEDIIRIIAPLYDYTPEEIRETTHKRQGITRTRQLICWFAYHYTDLTLYVISDETFSTHDGVLARAKAINDMLSYDKNLQEQINIIKIRMKNEWFRLEFKATRNYKEAEEVVV
jgi:chromosomal replication initiation ATPase DnaA